MSTHSSRAPAGTDHRFIADASQTGLDIGSAGTWEAWVRPAGADLSGIANILSKYLIAGNQRSYLMQLSGGTPRLILSDDGTAQTVFSQGPSPTADLWVHLAWTFHVGNNRVRAFQNGVQQGADQTLSGLGALFNGTSNFEIHQADGEANADRFQGNIDQVRVWNVERTPTEIHDNYQEDLGVVAGLQGNWLLDNNNNDASGNANTLTDSGAPTFVEGEVHGFGAKSFDDGPATVGRSVSQEPGPWGARIVDESTSAPSGVAPTISNVSPTDAGDLAADFATARLTPVTFDVTNGALALSVITLKYVGSNDTVLVHDGVNFRGVFASSTSSRVAITGGFRYTILPLGGWRSSIEELAVFAVNNEGVPIAL